MNTKYSINLRQFNNGESGKITFPTFEQCMMYGMHKLKEALKKQLTVVNAILIEAPNGRKIVVSPSEEELQPHNPIITQKIKLKYDPRDDSSEFTF